MVCDCIPTVDAMLAERNTRITLPIMLGSDQAPRPMIVTEQIESGRGKKKAVGMFATFCPFCGNRYESGQAEAGEVHEYEAATYFADVDVEGWVPVAFRAQQWDASIVFLAMHDNWLGDPGRILIDGELRWSGQWGDRTGVAFTESLNPNADPVPLDGPLRRGKPFLKLMPPTDDGGEP